MAKHRDEISQELWCRVYAKIVSKYNECLEGRSEAIRMADKAVEDFDKRYPRNTFDYGYEID